MEIDTSKSKNTAMQSTFEKAPPVYDWNEPNDPENPLNWTVGKKIYHTAIPSVFALVVFVFPASYESYAELRLLIHL